MTWWPVACLGAVLALARPAAADAVDRFIVREMQRQRIPGLALAVVKQGRVVKAKGYGWANLEHRVPVRPDTVFQSGSVGKQFTAACVLLLAEEARLGLDDSIAGHLANAPAAWQPVTVRHLLHHTSGLPDYTGADVIDSRRDYTEEELIQLLAAKPVRFAPGTDWAYCNTGYMLLGHLVRRVTGRFHGDFLRERLLVPLHMHDTRVISETDLVSRRAAGYRLVGGEVKNQAWIAPSLNRMADGCLYFTARDLVRWDAAFDSDRPISPFMRETMWTPARFGNGASTCMALDGAGYGCGWFVDKELGHRVVFHSGAWQGFKAQISRYLDDRLSVIVLCNLAEADPAALARGVARRVLPALRGRGLPDPDPTFTLRLQTALETLHAGQPFPEGFVVAAAAGSPPKWLRSLSQTLEAFGPPGRLELLEATEQDGVARRRYRASANAGGLRIMAVINHQGRVGKITAELE